MDTFILHIDTFHRVHCKNSSDQTFINGRAYDAVCKDGYWLIENENGEIRKVGLQQYEKYFESILMKTYIPKKFKGA